jgi:hypothetical protein
MSSTVFWLLAGSASLVAIAVAVATADQRATPHSTTG